MKKTLLALIGITAILFASCSNEDGGIVGPVDGGNTLLLHVNRPGDIDTRVAATEEEKEITSLYLLFFEPSTNGSGSFVDYIEITDLQGAEVEHDIDMSGTALDVTSAYNILALANVDGDGAHYLNNATFASWLQQWASKTQKEVVTEARAWTASALIPSNALLYSGITEKAANTFRVNLDLNRAQVRFDVVNNAATHALRAVYLYNAYPVAKIWNDGSGEGALDFSDNASRIEDYYGIADANLTTLFDTGATNEAVRGHFYTFPNTVVSPVQNDKLTTCLILGLEKTAGNRRYYRVNINPKDMPQMLKSEYAYTLTVKSVHGEGFENVNDAYNHPDDNGLDYNINTWDVDEIGVSDMDNNSMLASPYKTVNLDLFSGDIIGREDRGLPTDRFDITAVTSLTTPVSQLAIIGTPEFHLNGSEEPYDGIEVEIRGSELIFTKVDTVTVPGGTLESGDKVTGTINLGFAGLRIAINVVQTDIISKFINAFTPDDRPIPVFPSFGGIESGEILVESSEEWTAEILAEDGGFGFVGQTSLIKTGVSGDTFAVETTSDNPNSQKMRSAVVVVYLNSDGNNYQQVIKLGQQQKAEIEITPKQTVTFNGSGNLASVPNNTLDTFTVLSGATGEGNDATQNAWVYRIETRNPGTETWEAVFYEKAVPAHGNAAGVVPGKGDLNWFEVTNAVHDTTMGVANTFTVVAKGMNNDGVTRRSRIAVYLENGLNPDGPGVTKAYLDLVQNSSSISLSPNSNVPAVAKTGGRSAEVGINADGSLSWEVKGITPKYTGGTPVHHPIEVMVGDDVIATIDGTTTTIEPGDYEVSDKFSVRFPKIYYPNRNINIGVTVEVGIVGSELTSSMDFRQTALTSTGVYPFAPQVGGYGNIHGGAANYRYVQELRNIQKAPPSTTMNVNNNYMHMNYEGLSAEYNWNAVTTFREQRDGLLIVVNDLDYAPHLPMVNNSSSVLNKLGYIISAANGNGAYHNAGITSEGAGTKVYQMIIEGAGGGTNLTGTMNQPHTYMWVDDVSTCVTNMPDSAVPLITGNNNQQVLMTIDPKNNLIYQGESQVFDTVQGDWLLRSLLVYIKNAAMYGSAFTDLLVEDDQLTAAEEEAELTETAGNHFAPWDAYWGANAGIDR